jgi:signal transduction histidine kinase
MHVHLEEAGPLELETQRRWLLQFLLVLRILAVGFGLVELALGGALRHPPLAVIGLTTLLVSAATVLGRTWAQRGHLKAAASLAGYAVLLAGSWQARWLPYGTESLILVPSVAVAAMLPFLRGRALLAFICTAFVATIWISAGGALFAPAIALPHSTTVAIDVLSTPASTILLLFLLWQFSVRLQALVAQSTDARHRAESAVAEADRAVQLRDDFLSVASHELRTPLTSLQLSVDVSSRSTASPDRVARSLELAGRQVLRLTGLVDAMLSVGRIQLGRLELRLARMDLAALAKEVADRFALDLRRSGSVLRVQLETVFGTWDSERLDQVISNLLSNAIKFGEGRPIALSVARAGDRAVLRVEDQGIGVAPDQLARVFEKFERGVSSRHFGGLGLGLYISRAIVEAMGGTIRIESAGPGKGARVEVSLPAEGQLESETSRYGAARG